MDPIYKPLFPDDSDWPITKLEQNKKLLIEKVLAYATKKLTEKYFDFDKLFLLLSRAKDSELFFFVNNPQKYLDNCFWMNIDISLAGSKTYDDLLVILKKILLHYFDLIHGNFSPAHFKLAAKGVKYTLSHLLNPSNTLTLDQEQENDEDLRTRISIRGPLTRIRDLFKLGVLVFLPTHYSNLDSFITSWTTNAIGLPPVMYGAGVNLFNKIFWKYTLNKIGTYKVDRDKKNIIYLSLLEEYAATVMELGCSSLFYPHGTRSRTGAIENTIKRGLLSSVLTAQERLLSQEKPVFFVPVSISYPFVLEAQSFIENNTKNLLNCNSILNNSDNEKFSEKSKIYDELLKAKNIITKGSYLYVKFGKPFDVLGNEVTNTKTTTLNKKKVKSLIFSGKYKSSEHLKFLEKKIVGSLKKNKIILVSYLVSWSMLNLVKRRYNLSYFISGHKNSLDIKKISINKLALMNDLMYRLSKLKKMQKNKEVFLEDTFNKINSALELIKKGVSRLGAYHKDEIIYDKSDFFFGVKDLGLLTYYSNMIPKEISSKLYSNKFLKNKF